MTNRSLLIRLGRNLILIAVAAGVYFVFGLLGLLFKFGDPVGILMPSAGVALALVLLLGNRIVPGVAIGSFCVNAWAFDLKPGYLAFYLAGALGSALAASVGATLIRKKIGFPNALIDSKSIVSFMTIGGLLSCVIPATLATSSMLMVGIITSEKIAAAWFSWWLADVVGVLIFTPVLLSLFAQPHAVWSRRRITVGLPLMLAFALVLMLFSYLKNAEQNTRQELLKEKAHFLSQSIANRIRLDSYALNAIRDYLNASPLVAVENYSSMARQTVLPLKEIHVIAWHNFKENDPRKSPLVTIFREHPVKKPMGFINILQEIKEKWEGSAVLPDTEVLDADRDGFRLVLPVVVESKHKPEVWGAIVADISLDELVQAAFAGLNTDHCTVEIDAHFSDGGSSIKTVYAGVADYDLSADEAITVPVLAQAWQIRFHHDWARHTPFTDRSVQWVIFDGLCAIGILGMVLLQLTGKYYRTETLIAERTQTLEELRASAESANNAKNQFLAKISHELRTPLNGITGFTQLLEKRPTLAAEDKKHLAIIKQCSDNLLKLINDILDISAIESRQLKTEIGEFNYEALLNETVNIFRFRADEKGLTFISQNNCPHNKLVGDEKRIRQILANLIDNAIKYTNEGAVTIHSAYANGKLNISVADTGCGISKDNIDRIFSPFVQINSGNLSREGVGLGLSIIKELVHLMNGDLNVSSELGAGATFSITIPMPAVMEGRKKSSLAPKNQDAEYTGLRVLVADDSEINQLFLVCLLEQLGCKVDAVKNGQEALQRVERNFYDLALIDINMPVMDGYELVKHLRSRQLLLCLAAVSAYVDEERINEALKYGFDAYLTKPIDENELLELLKTIKKSHLHLD